MKLFRHLQIRAVSLIAPSPVVLALDFFSHRLLRKQSRLLPPIPDGLRLHVGAGRNILEGYENLDGYDNEQE